MKTVDPLDGIAVFLTVADMLNFSLAAERLGMSRATVSAQLQQLEKRLGVRLLHRSTRSVVLTEAGTAYRQALTGIVPQVREAERVALSFQKEAIGRLKVSAPPDLAQTHITPLTAEFLIANPALSIDLDVSLEAVNLIEAGFDLAIRGTISVEDNLVTRKIGQSPIHLCASPAYIARHGKPDRPEELADHACLHFSALRWGRVWPFARDEESVRVPIMPRFEINDAMSLRLATLSGAGLALLPAFIAGKDIREGRLVPLLADWTVASVPIHAVYPANRHIAVKVRQFVAFLAQCLEGHPDFRS